MRDLCEVMVGKGGGESGARVGVAGGDMSTSPSTIAIAQREQIGGVECYCENNAKRFINWILF